MVVCDGFSADCPIEAPKLTSSEPCRLKNSSRKGRCDKNGDCTGLCELVNLTSCQCPRSEEACQVCCRNDKRNGTCRLYRPLTSENDGVLCFIDNTEGICDDGKCTKYRRQIDNQEITLSVILGVMRENIVLTILVFSLLLWVPASCVVRWSDHNDQLKRELEQKHLRERVLGSFGGKESSTSSDPRMFGGRGSTASTGFHRGVSFTEGDGVRARTSQVG